VIAMFEKTLRAEIRSKIEEIKRRWRRSTTQGIIKMCLFNFIVWVLLLVSIVVCIAIPSLNSYTFPIFLLTAFYTTLWSMSEDPLTDPEEPLLNFIAKNIVFLIFGSLFVIGIFLAL
jgi:hypothetical protein